MKFLGLFLVLLIATSALNFLIISNLLKPNSFLNKKSPESTLEIFHKKIMVEKDFDGAYEMLSNENKKDVTKEIFSYRIKTLLKNYKYLSLYEYQAKRSRIKIIKINESGDLVRNIRFSFGKIGMNTNLFEIHNRRSNELGTEDAEKIFDDVFVTKLQSKYGVKFFVETELDIILLKENDTWKIDLLKPEKFLRIAYAFRHWFINEDKEIATKRREELRLKREEKLKNIRYSEIVYRGVVDVLNERSAKEVTLCVMGETGDITYGEAMDKFKQEGTAKIINNCIKRNRYQGY